MPMKEDDDEEVFIPAASIARDGKIEGLYLPHDQRRPLSSWEEPDAPLELQEQEPPPPPPEPAKSPGAGRGMAIAAGVAVLLICGAVLFAMLRKPAGTGDVAALPAASAEESPQGEEPSGNPGLTIQSDPSGAEVFVGAENVGRTPFLGSNELGKGERAQLRLVLPGYQTWTSSFAGGANVKLRAKLKRK